MLDNGVNSDGSGVSRHYLQCKGLRGTVLEGDGSVVDEDIDATVVLLHEVANPILKEMVKLEGEE